MVAKMQALPRSLAELVENVTDVGHLVDDADHARLSNQRTAVASTGLEQQHAKSRILGEPARDDASRRTRTNDRIVKLRTHAREHIAEVTGFRVGRDTGASDLTRVCDTVSFG